VEIISFVRPTPAQMAVLRSLDKIEVTPAGFNKYLDIEVTIRTAQAQELNFILDKDGVIVERTEAEKILKGTKAAPTKLQQLKEILESQDKNQSAWPVLEISEDLPGSPGMELILNNEKVTFVFDETGDNFLGVVNWKESGKTSRAGHIIFKCNSSCGNWPAKTADECTTCELRGTN
jgi:hypothetical protein